MPVRSGSPEAVATALTGRSKRWPPLTVGALALAGCALVAVADPAVPGRYGVCPFLLVSGWWCPLCGSLRAVHHLARADVAGAAGANLLLVAAVPVLVYGWIAWTLPRLGLRAPPLPRLPVAGWWGLLTLLLVFGVLRNLAPLAWLAPEAVWPAR